MRHFLLLVACLLPAADPAYQVVHGWPLLPDGFAFGHVSGVGVDSHNHVWVFHRGDRPILCFDGPSGKILASFGDGMFTTAHGLTLDRQDNIWITDTGSHIVQKFSHKGELLLTLGAKGVPGLDPFHFNRPTDVAIGPDGAVYVSDGYGNNRVVKFDASGAYLTEWGSRGDKPGEFDLPHGIAADARGRIYVADRSNARVQVFESNGKFIAQWKSPQLGRPWGLTARDGSIFVVDGGDMKPKPPDRGRVSRADPDGKILDQFGSFGSYDGQFYWAHDVAAGADGAVYVADVHLGMRIQKFLPRK